ncbi:MAG: helix-turn-helix domain-containing protein [Phycisphaerales bacterium]
MTTAPPSLVGLSESPASSAASFDFTTPLLCAAVALGLAAILYFAARWMLARRTKSVSSSAVLVSMCSGLKLTRADQRLLRQLAQNHGPTSPVTLLLCPSVFERAAAQAARTVDKEALHRLRQRLAA